MCAFTRHPTALATALGTLASMKLRYAVARLMEILVMNADRQGVYWGKTTKEVERQTGMSRNTIKVAARDARRLGLLEWLWIKTRQRYPKRVDYETFQWGKGADADNGGRVWVVQWRSLGVPWSSYDLGPHKRLICVEPGSDQSRVICADQSILTDLSGSSNLTNDPAAAQEAPAPAAARPQTIDGPEGPAQTAGPVPVRTELARSLEGAKRAPAAPPAPPETSREGAAARPAPQGRPEIERLRGVVGPRDTERAAPDAPERPATAAEAAAFLAQMRALGPRKAP